MPQYLLVSTTAGSRDSALKLLRSAVRERPAASGQALGPVLSAFWHNEEFGEGEERQVFLKTEADQCPHPEPHLRVNHPWDELEVTAYTIVDGTAAYLDWISRTVS